MSVKGYGYIWFKNLEAPSVQSVAFPLQSTLNQGKGEECCNDF